MPSSFTDPEGRSRSRDVPIRVTLEHARVEHRVARLTAALDRLRRLANEATASGQAVPLALHAAERTFTGELAESLDALQRINEQLGLEKPDSAQPPAA